MAVKTWTGAGVDNNWSTGGNWSGGTAPTTGGVDDIIFDGAFLLTGNKNCTLNVAFTALSINFTGYTGQFTFAQNLSSGNTTLGPSTSYVASGGNPTTYTFTTRNANLTFTANGKILPTNLSISLSGASTLTFAGNADFGGNLSTSATAHNIKAATGTTIDLRIGGNITLSAVVVNTTDHVTIKGYGTSKTYTSSLSATNIRCNFISGSSYTSANNSGLSGASFLTVESGGQFNAVSTHSFSNNNTTTLSGFNSSNNSDFFGYTAGTLVLSTDTVIKSFIQIQSLSITITSSGSSKLLLEGNFTSIGTGATSIDKLEFSGTTASNVTATSALNLQIKEFIINKTGGGSVNFNSNGIFTLFVPSSASYSFTHTNGIVTQNSTSIVRFYCNNAAATMTYSQTNMSFRYLELAGGTLNLNSQLIATTLRLSTISNMVVTSSTTFGFNVEALQVLNTSGATRTVTLKSAVIYNTTAVLIMISTASTAPITLNASTAGVKAIFNLDNSASQTVEYVNATDIDSSGTLGVIPFSKQLIYSLAGVITTTFNWSTGNQPPPIAITRTVAHTFVS